MNYPAADIKKLLWLLLLFCSSIAAAQVMNIGKIITYKQVPGGIQGKTATSMFAVYACSNNSIRVRVSKDKSFSDFSYALVNPAVAGFNAAVVEDKGNIILLSTSTVDVEITKAPSFRVAFKNKAGTIINEDAAGDCFGTTFIGDKVSVYKKMQDGERFVGMGEALGNLDKRGTGITLNNTDTYKYGDPRLSMYVSIPFYIGIHHGEVYGIFYNNSYRSFFNFGLSTPQFTSVNIDGGEADYFFMYDESVAKIIEAYTALTGRIQLPPQWATGYHQSRCSYYPQEKVEWIAATFRQKKIPIDCIVLDADYQQGYQPFRVNKERFPSMPALAASLARQNIELTASVYPGVAIDTSYHSYRDGLAKDVFIKYADGSLFNTEIAPVKCYLPDYTNPKTRQWWKDKMKWLPDNGIHGYWNDMNEPALGGSYLPDNLLFDFDGRKANALEAKNVYGFQMARSSFEAALQNSPTRRPFILTRSGFAGVQRYSAVWSGDNTASDEGLLSSLLLNSQMGLSGLSFCGHDIGGFIGDGSKELFRRWIQAGVFSPFCRNHKGCGGPAGEPWAYGDEVEAISKTFIEFRYRLMPYIYAAFNEASTTGMPVARSLCIYYPHDDKVYDNSYQYQFLFGDALMVVPVTSTETIKKMYLPKGDWYNLYTDEKLQGAKEWTAEVPVYQVPVFVKAASIIPMQGIVQSTKELPGDTLWLHVYNGKEKSSFTYYEDKGDGFEYRQGDYCKRVITFDPAKKQLLIEKQQGSFNSRFKKVQVVFHGMDSMMSLVRINGSGEASPAQGNEPILDALKYLGDVYDPSYYQSIKNDAEPAGQKIVSIDNAPAEIVVQWK